MCGHVSTDSASAAANPAITIGASNWLITPAADPVGRNPPARIEDQRWLVALTGVAIVNLKGTSTSWLRQTLPLIPPLRTALSWAVDHYGIPRPNPSAVTNLQADQWAPFVSLGSIHDQGQSINAGFAVDGWRPAFGELKDLATGAIVDNAFLGVQVDVAVSDTDATLHRLGYQMTLAGRIFFSPGRPAPGR